MSRQDRHGLHIRTFAIGEGQILQRIRNGSCPWKDGTAIAAADPAFLNATAWTAPDGTTRLRLHPGDSAGAIAEYCSGQWKTGAFRAAGSCVPAVSDHPADKMINLRVHVRMASGEIAGHVHDGRRTWVVSSQYSGQPEGAAAA